ncbi:hypothetical protein F0562_015174 [Nyssa sinensis]|uniref:Uncharacterized protein n=1 Tax=Nyssa sinensis TaxID=561372 RepID=A0A5J4ZGN1_9ASTE|nr:hypothetical protein F0562_015174 [Nyssa sinensis]
MFCFTDQPEVPRGSLAGINSFRMVSTGNNERAGEVQAEFQSSEMPNGYEANGQIHLYISTSRKGLLSDGDSQSGSHDITPPPSRLRFLNCSSASGLASPSGKFRRIAEEKDEISQSVPSSTGQGLRQRFNGVFTQKIDLVSLWKTSRRWIRNPLNMALFLWISCVAVSGAILFLVMTGMLNGAIPKKSQRNAWFEYALCGLNLGFKRSERPAIGVGICLSVAIAAPAVAGLYSILSPLGREYDLEIDEEAQDQILTVGSSQPSHLRLKSLEKRLSFASRNDQRIIEIKPVVERGNIRFWGRYYFSISLSFLYVLCLWMEYGETRVWEHEVRTADSYDVIEDKFCRKHTDENSQPPLSPLPRENGSVQFRSGQSSPLWNPRLSMLSMADSSGPSRFSKDYYNADGERPQVGEEFSPKGVDNSMRPPIPSLIKR